jgi:hypothetical protein
MMAVFTPFRAFDDATPIRFQPAAAKPRLIACWSTDDDGRLVRHWRTVVANQLITGRLGQ